jgi:glucose uptake protein
MIVPTTYIGALLITILSMICWGSWANTQKLAGKWRFELFYFDYTFGVILCAIVAAATFGSMNPQELTVMDSFALVGYRQIAYGLAGGAVFNLANILLVSAIAISGLAVAFPIGIGLALVIGVILNYILNPQGNPAFLFIGAGLVVGAIVVDAIAYRMHDLNKSRMMATKEAAAQASAGARTAHRTRSNSRHKPQTSSSAKGIVLSLVAGVLMGLFYPLVEMGKSGDNGLTPYAIGLVFCIGVFITTFIFNVFFMLAPVQGEAVSIVDYFRGTKKQHLLGVLGGVIWCVGTLSNFVASSAPKAVQVGPAISYALGQGATMISALWGLLVWKEFAGSTTRVRVLLVIMMCLFLVGLTMVAVAPLYAR